MIAAYTEFQTTPNLFRAAARLLRAPANTAALLELGDAISTTRWFARSLQAAKAQHGVDVSRDASLRIPQLGELSRYPGESLGARFSCFMATHRLTEFRSVKPPSNEREWLRERSRVVHDLLHVILDYGIEVEDEIKLNAHLAFSIGLPISCLIVSGGLIRIAVTKPQRLLSLARELCTIRARVRNRRCLILEPIEDWLHEPVSVVRARLLG